MTQQRVFSPSFAATYRGVVYADERSFPKGFVGPNTMGEFFKPVSAVYDTETDRTRVEFDIYRPSLAELGGAS